MSRNASQPSAPSSHRASVRAMWAIAAVLAVSYAGDEHIVRRDVLGQASPAETASLAESPSETAPPAATATPEASPAAVSESTADVVNAPTSDSNTAESPAEVAEGAAAEDAIAGEPKARLAPKEDIETALTRKRSLILRDATLADWITAISETWNVDIIFDPTELQQHRVSGGRTEKTLEEVLKSILTPKGFGYKKDGNGLAILRQSEIGDINLQQVNETIYLDYLEPEQIETSLKVLMSPSGRTQSIPSPIRALMVIDQPENVKNVKEHIANLEERARKNKEKESAELRREQDAARAAQQGTTTAADGSEQPLAIEPTIRTSYRAKYVRVADVQDAVAAQLEDGTVSAIESENVLVLMGRQSAIQATLQLLRELDMPRRQVRISVMMYDVSIDALEALGFNWRNAGKDNIASNGVPNALFDVHSAPMQMGSGSAAAATTTSTTGTATSTATATGTTSSTPFGGFITSTTPNFIGSAINLYYVTRYFDISAVIQALQQTDGARLLADPTVTVYDLEESQIRIVSEIPVQQLTQTEGGGSIGTTAFREAGITLTVMPEIADENTMLLTVAPEFSALQGFSSSGQPIINRRQESTKVKMNNGETLVLGGLRKREEIERVAGVPGLMNIKYLGNLFRSHRTTITESELIIFIHAEIVNEGCGNTPREQVAAQVTQETLDQIPHASHAPFIPPCNDPYCPYHNPKPRPSQGELLAPGDWDPAHGTEPSTEANGKKRYPAPLHGRPGHDATPGASPIQAPPEPDASPESFQPNAPAYEPPDPPPVSVDQSARLQGQQLPHMAMRRLPSVYETVSTEALVQTPAPATKKTDRPKLPVGTDPKARIATAPGKRPAPSPSSTAPTETKKSIWAGSIFR